MKFAVTTLAVNNGSRPIGMRRIHCGPRKDRQESTITTTPQNHVRDSTEQWLASVWQDALQLKTIGLHDDFFELGGTPSTANRLFSEIAERTGRNLSPLIIYQARTISALADVLRDPHPVRLQTAVLLRSGEMPPGFLIPGLGGTVMEFFKLLKYIESGHRFYGLQSRGLDGLESPFNTVEELAKSYVAAILRVQPVGPYTLIGYSLGGLICLEIAHELLNRGQKISQLIMIETYPHRTHLPYRLRLSIIGRLIGRRLKRDLGKISPLAASNADSTAELEGLEIDPKFVPTRENIVASGYRAWRLYQPQSYSGEVHYVRATEIDALFPQDPRAAWRKWITNLTVEVTPGTHLGLVGKEYRSLARVLSRHLKSASQKATNIGSNASNDHSKTRMPI